jgi:hypothetical protein
MGLAQYLVVHDEVNEVQPSVVAPGEIACSTLRAGHCGAFTQLQPQRQYRNNIIVGDTIPLLLEHM